MDTGSSPVWVHGVTMKFTGIVKKHLGRGQKLGFPTANIEAPKDLQDAIYLGLVHCHTVSYDSEGQKPALVFIGVPETFAEIDRRAEAYVLDFTGDLYGQEIEIEIVKKLRENRKFDSEEALVEQMKKDEADARKFFGM